MKYFQLNYRDAVKAMEAVWENQDKMHMPRSYFHTSAIGLDASVWTEDAKGENLLSIALEASSISYIIGPEQQVHAKGFGIG